MSTLIITFQEKIMHEKKFFSLNFSIFTKTLIFQYIKVFYKVFIYSISSSFTSLLGKKLILYLSKIYPNSFENSLNITIFMVGSFPFK